MFFGVACETSGPQIPCRGKKESSALYVDKRKIMQRAYQLWCLFLGLKASLERLQLDYVDVVFANRPDPNTPMEGNSSVASALCYIHLE